MGSLYYATYKGPQPVATVGDGFDARGYPAGQTVQIGEADATAIREQDSHEFELQPVPSEIVGTAENAHPTDPGAAQALNDRLAALDGEG